MTLKDTLILAGVLGAVTAVSAVLIAPDEAEAPKPSCIEEEVQVWVNKESACIADTKENRRIAMYQELITEKTDKNGNKYDIEIANWNTFWETLTEAAIEKGITPEQLEELIHNSKEGIVNLLKPEK